MWTSSGRIFPSLYEFSIILEKVIEMPEHNPGRMGGKTIQKKNDKWTMILHGIGTMRLGRRTTYFVTDDCTVSTYRWLWVVDCWCSFSEKLYGNANSVDERHRHRYEVNPSYIEAFETAGMKFVGRSDDNQRMEILELEGQSLHHLRFLEISFLFQIIHILLLFNIILSTFLVLWNLLHLILG